jgi:hypothetical protein
MSAPQLHIISFDVPLPANYGGVIDVWYKIKALRELGVEITLHAFTYGRAPVQELNHYCKEVHYYERSSSWLNGLASKPYIVLSRANPPILENLQKDEAPILFEGLHSCAFLDAPELKHRVKIVRTHNIEHDYYNALASVESNWLKSLYFKREAKKLRAFESVLNNAQHIIAISPADTAQLQTRYSNVQHVMAFHAYNEVAVQEGSGDYCLYHGNLAVGENNEAALFLVREVFASGNYRLIVAGNNPSAALKSAMAEYKNMELRSDISTAEIDHLIANAQINVLPTFQATGIKLKLLAALFQGRHCLVNDQMVANTGLESICEHANNAEEWRLAVDRLMKKAYGIEAMQVRQAVLKGSFSNLENARKIKALL